MPTRLAQQTRNPVTRIIPDMSLTDLIYAKTGIRIGAEKSGADHESQVLITALLVLVAKSDGGISPIKR